MTVAELPLNGFDILAIVLGANLLIIWGVYGLWRLNKKDDWDWQSIMAIGVPGIIMCLSVYFGNGFG